MSLKKNEKPPWDNFRICRDHACRAKREMERILQKISQELLCTWEGKVPGAAGREISVDMLQLTGMLAQLQKHFNEEWERLKPDTRDERKFVSSEVCSYASPTKPRRKLLSTKDKETLCPK